MIAARSIAEKLGEIDMYQWNKEASAIVADMETLENKYHDTSKEFNAYARFIYHGWEYDVSTGYDDAEMDAELAKLNQTLMGEAHPIHKAKLFAFVLDHTRIEINEHDYFVGIYANNRPLLKYISGPWGGAVYASFPEEQRILHEQDRAGAAYGWLDFDHTVPDWDRLMNLGFPGILAAVRQSRSEKEANGTLTEKQRDFARGMEIAYEAILRLTDRLAKRARTMSFAKAEKIAVCMEHLRDGAPQDLYDAMQMIYLYFMISECIDNYQVRSLGYGLDATLMPFFERDLADGRYSMDDAAELLGYFLMQWSAIGNYWGQPFYLGGMNADGTTKVNVLTCLILEVYDKLGIYNPKIQIKVNRSTPKDFILQALEMIRHGNSSIVFCSDDIITRCLMSRGATYEEAVDSVISGCYEYKCKGKDIGACGAYFNALKPISLVFDNGVDVRTGLEIGLKTGTLDTLIDFAAFYRAYLDQLAFMMRSYIGAINRMETRIDEINPSLMFSATVIPCVDTLTDALDSGLENTTDMLLSGLGTAVDALMAVKALVYDQKIVSLQTLNEALHADWVGYEDLRTRARNCPKKYGCGDAETDNYAAAILGFVHDLFAGKRNLRGGQYLLEMHSARAYIVHGEKTIATPDGRHAGEEMSKNASPTPGADRHGVTALIRSATTMHTAHATNGFCLDVFMHPTAVQGEDGLSALYAVLQSYLQMGGASIQFNIFNAELLRDAQKHPEKYRNLQVRVCGWNVLFNNMPKIEQDKFIERAEAVQ